MFSDVWFFDSIDQEWRSFTKSKPYGGSLVHVSHAMGIWVNVTVDSNLTVAGLVPNTTEMTLLSGWNLVGFPSFNVTYTIGDLKVRTGATRVEGFSMSNPPYFLSEPADGVIMLPGHGYWVWVETDTKWTVGNP
jgi:hypothetical protein